VVKKGDFDLDIELSISQVEAGRCCGTRRMVFIARGTKGKRHGQKLVFVFKGTLKL
jgi:hypothetical protein